MSKPYDTNIKLDVEELRVYLNENPDVFDIIPDRRTAPGTPHSEMVDIWCRYCVPGGDRAGEHESVWYPVAGELPRVQTLVSELMNIVNGQRLGAVLITKLPPGGRVHMHTDRTTWHANHYEKFLVPIQNLPGANFLFSFDDETNMVVSPGDGEVWWFDNDEKHGVLNDSSEDRIAMIVCIYRGGHSNGSNFLNP